MSTAATTNAAARIEATTAEKARMFEWLRSVALDEGNSHARAAAIALQELVDYADLRSQPAEVAATQCAHPNVIDGYQGGYDMSWCDDCGTITRCSDGLIPQHAVGRNDRSDWCAKRVVAYGCEREAKGGVLCKTWCSNRGCSVSIRVDGPRG